MTLESIYINEDDSLAHLQTDCFDDMTKKQRLDRPFLLMDY